MGKHYENNEDKLKRYSKLDPNTGCIVWIGGTWQGHGFMRVPKKGTRRVHIVAWECVHGTLPKGFSIRFKCDNKLCINVQHMFLFNNSEEASEDRIAQQLNRLKDKISINPNTHCWEWQGARYPRGYGKFHDGYNSNGKINITYAHRVMWKYMYGETNGLHVLHKCDNPCCINPEHLFLGTHADNMRDMACKGRTRSMHKKGGTRNKLNVSAVRDIRTSGNSPQESAKKYNVSIDTIYAVLKRKNWKHIE